MLPTWEDRPQILANLINPAFCGKILYNSFKGYNEDNNQKFPFALSFFILPMVLHPLTRKAIPTTSKKTFHAWIDENSEIKISFPNRIANYIPFTKESIMFLIAAGSISINENGNIDIKSLKASFKTEEDNSEVIDCFKKAQTLGKILSKSGNIFTIYSILGVKP